MSYSHAFVYKSHALHKLVVGWCIFLVVFFGFSFSVSHAATLSIVPSGTAGSYAAGQLFSVQVSVSTVSDEPLNAVSGVISFPTSLLQVVSVDTSGGIVDFWIGNPAYSNAEGTINFEGGIYNPGFSGAGGKVLSVLFKAKSAGPAVLSFISSSVLANDGRGTNILDSASPVTVSIGATQTPPVTTAEAVGNHSLLVYSSTHPNPTAWYSATKAHVSWKLPKGATAVRTKLDQNPFTVPSVLYSPPVSEKELSLTQDGVWYFHVQAQDNVGWGPVTHFKMQVDTRPPEPFTVKFPHGASTDDPRPIILFNTTDKLSGIDYYDVTVGGAHSVRVNTDIVDSNPYSLPDQDPGERAVKVVAYDRAGNAAIATSSFMVSGLLVPEFDEVTESLVEGDNLQFVGSTYSKAKVTVFLKDEDGNVTEQSTMSGVTGRFLIVWKKNLVRGTYVMTSQVTDERGAKSVLTEERFIEVRSPALSRIGIPILNYVTFLVLIIGSLGAILVWSWYVIHHVRKFKKKLGGKVKRTEERVHADFKKLSKIVSTQVKILEKVSAKRALTSEETALVETFREALSDAEESIEKGIREMAE